MKNINSALIKCAIIIVLIGFPFAKSYAQGTLLNETSLEEALYKNQKNGLNPFQGILEQHVYKVSSGISKNELKILAAEIKKNETVVDVSKDTDKIIILVKKSEMKDASYILTSVFNSLNTPFESHYVLYYLKN